MFVCLFVLSDIFSVPALLTFFCLSSIEVLLLHSLTESNAVNQKPLKKIFFCLFSFFYAESNAFFFFGLDKSKLSKVVRWSLWERVYFWEVFHGSANRTVDRETLRKSEGGLISSEIRASTRT